MMNCSSFIYNLSPHTPILNTIESIYILMSIMLMVYTVKMLNSNFAPAFLENSLNHYLRKFTYLMVSRLILVVVVCALVYLNSGGCSFQVICGMDPNGHQYQKLLEELQLYSLINFNQLAIYFWLNKWTIELQLHIVNCKPI
jgi:hypothetical protein